MTARTWPRRIFSPAIRGRSFARDETGAVAIEFAALALPFFTLIYAILETAIVFLSGQILDSAVHDASRKLRTGQAQAAGWSPEQFRQEICNGLYGMFDCTALHVSVSVVDTFAEATVTSPVDPQCLVTGQPEDCTFVTTPVYDAGTGSNIVIVQTFYKWPTIVNLPGFNDATQAGGSRLLSAVRVFRNEPFS